MGKTTRILVLGGRGQLASALKDAAPDDLDVVTMGRPGLDVRNLQSLHTAIEAAKPDVVINAAAYTAVDRAEAEPEAAFAVNRDGARHAALACAAAGVRLVHVSTDYVFDGAAGRAYCETDAPHPLSVYGASKLAGESEVLDISADSLVVRTSWLVRPGAPGFVSAMIRLAGEREVVDVVDDQLGCLTGADDLAAALIALASNDGARGVLHVAGGAAATWRTIAGGVMAALAERGLASARVRPISTEQFGAPAPRPADSRLDCGLALDAHGLALPGWSQTVAACVAAVT